MTLVVARVVDNGIYIIGDTALTFAHAENANPFIEGCLKQYRINACLAFAWAGNQVDVESIITDILSCESHDQIIEIALSAQRRGLDFELLVAETSNPTIYFIKNRELQSSSVGYIGNHEAFNAYQIYFHEDAPSARDVPKPTEFQCIKIPEPLVNDGQIYKKMFNAFKKVISNEDAHDVGGVLISLCTDNGKFQYMPYANAMKEPVKVGKFNDTLQIFKFGTAQEGGYTVDFNDDRWCGGLGNNIGYYFLQGGFGIVFLSNYNSLRTAHVIDASTPVHWVLNTAKEFGSGIGSFLLNPHLSGSVGESFLVSEKYDDALFCYSLSLDSINQEEYVKIYDRYIAGYATSIFQLGKKEEAVGILLKALAGNSNLKCCAEMLMTFDQSAVRKQ